MAKTLHHRLAEQAAEDIRQVILDSLPRIADAIKGPKKSASISVTLQFTTDVEGNPTLSIKPRERIPLEPIEYEMARQGEQLRLQLRLVERPEAGEPDEEELDGADVADGFEEAAVPA